MQSYDNGLGYNFGPNSDNNHQNNNGNMQRGPKNKVNFESTPINNSGKIGINDILLAPITALYSFTLKIHEGFRLDEEVKVLASLQMLYLILGMITNSKTFLIFSIGNILSIVMVLILASSYINLPDYLKPEGLLNKVRNNYSEDEYEEAMRHQQQYNGYNQSNQYNNQQYNQQYNGNPNPYQNQNINQNINENMKFSMNNFEEADINKNTNGFERNPSINNMANDFYNGGNPDTHPFNSTGLNTESVGDTNVMFGINNASGVVTPGIGKNNNKYFDTENPFGGEAKLDFDEFNNKQEEVSYSQNNIFRNNVDREELYKNNPYRSQLINSNEDKLKVMDSLKPTSNHSTRTSPSHKLSTNLMDMIMDGLTNSLQNSNLNDDDSEFEII